MIPLLKNALVTTCLNEKNNVTKWINDVMSQTMSPNEICITDAGSTDGTLEILQLWAKNDSRVKILVAPKCNVAEGRNKAIMISRGEIIVSTDMGCRLDSHWVENLCKPFGADAGVEVVAGNYMVDRETIRTAVAKAACYLFNDYCSPMDDAFLPSSRSIAYLRRVWLEVGGYPEDMSFAGDDTVFALQVFKAGYSIHKAKDAICFWGRHDNMEQYWKESYLYSVGNGEAGVFPPRFMTKSTGGYSRFLACCDATRRATVSSRSAILKALARFDLAPALLIPLLQFGYVMSSYRGYAIGYNRGEVKCRETRKRLA